LVDLSCAGVSEEERRNIRQKLITDKDFVDAGVFTAVKDQSLDLLQQAWIDFLKRDFKNFLKSVIVPILAEILSLVSATLRRSELPYWQRFLYNRHTLPELLQV